MILRRQARTGIDHEHDDVGLRHGLLGLLGHLAVDAGRGIGLEAARIDHDVLVLALLAVAVMPVPGQAGEIGDDRIPRLGERLNSVDLPTLGRPTRAMTGFILMLVILGGSRRCRRCG